jgi:hypothetical protein
VPVNTEKTILDLHTTRSKAVISRRNGGDYKVVITDLEHRHFVCKVKLVMSARGLYWSGGFTLGIFSHCVFLLVQSGCFVPTFFGMNDSPYHGQILRQSGSHHGAEVLGRKKGMIRSEENLA